MLPVSNEPSPAVAVWAVLSSFVQVTLSPTFTVTRRRGEREVGDRDRPSAARTATAGDPRGRSPRIAATSVNRRIRIHSEPSLALNAPALRYVGRCQAVSRRCRIVAQRHEAPPSRPTKANAPIGDTGRGRRPDPRPASVRVRRLQAARGCPDHHGPRHVRMRGADVPIRPRDGEPDRARLALAEQPGVERPIAGCRRVLHGVAVRPGHAIADTDLDGLRRERKIAGSTTPSTRGQHRRHGKREDRDDRTGPWRVEREVE